MIHYAQLDENNVVIQVIVVSNENVQDENGNEVEEIGIAFCKNLLGPDTRWVRTSYNNNFRKGYAYLGYSYNQELDCFIPPKPFGSFLLNKETADWESPIGPAPILPENSIKSGLFYRWDEEAHQADNTTGWILQTPSVPE